MAAAAVALAGCAGVPAEPGDAPADATAAGAPPADTPAQNGARKPATAYTDQQTIRPSPSDTTPTRTVTLPAQGRVSLSEYRAQMREQLMRSENASADVADCAAHASWVVPRSATYDALRIPTGALGADQARVEPWQGRFSSHKQAVPVSSVVTFSAAAHRRAGESRWDPVQVRCGYDEGMMLAYELLDDDGSVIVEPAARSAVRPAASPASQKTKARGKGTRSGAKATSSKAKGKSTTSSASAKSGARTKTKTKAKSSR
ncbi:hypothetical protein K6V06_02185 [Cupriavidus sp. AU9028]|nr:hypothetical protein [Cupriavidus sp. AU9028]MBY4895802.1 hypothetical protein [Cupriavidus sp. AU9028]